MAREPIRETYNDGRMSVLTQTTIRNDAGKKTGNSDKEIAVLFYSDQMIRERDIDQVQALGSRLSRKIKTPFHPALRKINKDKVFVLLDELRYNVIYVDPSENSLYFYLESVGEKNEPE